MRMKNRVLSEKARSNIFVFLMLIIPVVHFIVFWGGVNFNSLRLAFTGIDLNTGEATFSMDHFRSLINLFKTGELRAALVNTLLTSAFHLALVPWALFLSYFLYRKIPLERLWKTLLFLPSILPAIAMTSIFKYLIDAEGPVSQLWLAMTGEEMQNLLAFDGTAKWTILMYIFWTNFGGQFILISGAMAKLPKSLLEAAHLDGAGLGTEFFKVVLPLCWPTISMILILNISSMFTATGPLLLLTKGLADTKTIAYWIFERVQGSTTLGLPAALGITCTVILFPIVMLAKWLLNKVYADVEF